MAATFTGFAPLGLVLLVMLGAGVAERVGLLTAAIEALVRASPKALLTPIVLLIDQLSNHAADLGSPSRRRWPPWCSPPPGET